VAISVMPLYSFAIHEDARAPEVRTSTLPDDDSAWDYGETIIRSLLRSDAADDSRVMVISEGQRIVASIEFNLAALRTRRTLQ
jgi:hypothetical protein